ncbi:YggS family pyridoxal phosphate-dependent enzyme [Candidatus Saganbacteria bacterium]|nr:YggS family pyridoxal phosphate-dependent enzyme [Candidatus Saganbacteria bacterium]
MGIRENIEEIKANSKGALLLAVTKNVDLPQIIEAIEAGVTDIGESYVQEAKSKISILKSKFPKVRFHLIGHLQTNKVKTALELFDVIQSVDSFHLAEEISKRATKPVEIFIEVNTSGEESKFGIAPEKAVELIGRITGLPNLRISGLMTIGNSTREGFRLLRELRDRAGIMGLKLSMGMSHDYALAIEEGSDIIRIGEGIFGPRRI